MKQLFFAVVILTATYFANPVHAQWQVIGSQIPSTSSGLNDGKVFFLNDTLGYGLFNKTTDGGNSWQLMSGVQGGSHIYFTDALIGHRVHNTNTGPPAYERTLDGGNSWQELSSALPTDPYGYYDVFFTSTDTGYIINMGRVFKTTDTGTTWVTKYQNTATIYFFATSLYFPTSEIGYVVGYHAFNGTWLSSDILITRNGGNTWDSVPLPFSSSQPKVFAPDTNHVYVIANPASVGKIIHSDDGGNNWTEQYSDSNKTLWDIFFPTKDTGYVVGANYESGADTGLVLKTTDGGDNWMVQSTEYNKILRDCHFISSDIGWIAGGNGEILHTTNGGGLVGISEPNVLQSKINIYPNPTNGIINIQIESQSLVTVFDIHGKIVLEKLINPGEQLMFVQLSDGIYSIRVKNEKGISFGKIILNK